MILVGHKGIIKEPDDGIIADRGTMKVAFDPDKMTYLAGNPIVEDSKAAKVRMDCNTSIDWLGGDVMSVERLKRKHADVMNQLAARIQPRGKAMTEYATSEHFWPPRR